MPATFVMVRMTHCSSVNELEKKTSKCFLRSIQGHSRVQGDIFIRGVAIDIMFLLTGVLHSTSTTCKTAIVILE